MLAEVNWLMAARAEASTGPEGWPPENLDNARFPSVRGHRAPGMAFRARQILPGSNDPRRAVATHRFACRRRQPMLSFRKAFLPHPEGQSLESP
jgi:hypothetical protein